MHRFRWGHCADRTGQANPARDNLHHSILLTFRRSQMIMLKWCKLGVHNAD
jgi:hypothetical protein